MKSQKYSIRYSPLGGLYLGKGIHSDIHRHHVIALVIALSGQIRIRVADGTEQSLEAALIPTDVDYSLDTEPDEWTVFVHLDPYSEIGLELQPDGGRIHQLRSCDFPQILSLAEAWVRDGHVAVTAMESSLRSAGSFLKSRFPGRTLDDRVLKCIRTIDRSGVTAVSLGSLSAGVFLSPSRLAHLFKKDTGISLRRYLQHRKLISSLKAMDDEVSLTDASFAGGFSDQPHFTKAFKRSFGIKPSISRTAD